MKRTFPTIEPAWVWPDKVSRWIRERCEGRVLHVCCGKSTIGDVRIDRDPRNEPDIVADMDNLPVSPATFDTGVWDPPWKIDCFSRHEPYFELVRAVKPNGKLLVNATWIPFSQQTPLEDLWVRQDNDKAGFSLLSELRRWPGQQTLSRSTAVADGGLTEGEVRGSDSP